MLTDDFNSEATKTAKEAFDYGMREEGAAEIGLIETANDQHAGIDGKKDAERKKKEDQRLFHDVLHLLDDYRRKLLDDIDRIQEEINELIRLRDLVMERKEALEEFLDERNRTGEFNLGDDGYPTNEKAKDAIKAWEQRTGQTWDAQAQDAHIMIRLIIDEHNQEIEDFGNRIKDKFEKELDPALKDLEEIDEALESGVVTQVDVDRIKRRLEAEKNSIEELNSTEQNVLKEEPTDAIDFDMGF
ncbi:MAG: hypothetical protein JXR11_02535 [Balneola sp.]